MSLLGDHVDEYIELIDPYDPELADRIQERWDAGIDITDELYEALIEHVGTEEAEEFLNE